MKYRLFTDFVIILQYNIENFKSLNLIKGEKYGME